MEKKFKLIIEAISNRKPLLTLRFDTELEMKIAYEVLLNSVSDTACYLRTLERNEYGEFDGYSFE
jgi:hypothetical protein